MAALVDGVVLTCGTTGTGTLSLSTPVNPYMTMAQAGATSGLTYSYSIIDAVGGNSEYGRGVWTSSGNTLTRATVLWSTNSGSKISCSGQQIVRITVLAEDIALLAPLASPTFSGTVTMPDSGTWGSGGISGVTSLGSAATSTVTSGNNYLNQNTLTLSPTAGSSAIQAANWNITELTTAETMTGDLYGGADLLINNSTGAMSGAVSAARSVVVKNLSTGSIAVAAAAMMQVVNSGGGSIGTEAVGGFILTPVGATTGLTSTWNAIYGWYIQDQNPSGAGTNTLTTPPSALVIASQSASGAFAINQQGSGINSFGGVAQLNGGTFAAAVPGGLINVLHNGPLDVWQRGTSSITVTTSGAYTADGYLVLPTGASCTAAQASNNRSGANTLYGLQLTGASSVTDIQVIRRIESVIAARLAGKTVTVQAQVYNNTGGSITPTLTTKYAGSTDVWTSPTTDLSATNLQACANGAWTQVAYTLSVSASATAGYEFIFDFGNHFSTTGKDVVIAELDVRVTPGTATGLNSYPPPPELRPIAIELPFCQRYFQTSYPQGTAPGTSFSAGDAGVLFLGSSAGYLGGSVAFATPMRAAPTLTLYDTAGNSGKISTGNSGGSWTTGQSTVWGPAETTFGFYTAGDTTGSGDTWYGVNFGYTASAEL